MKGALIILGVIIAIGVILYLGELRHRRKEEARLAEEPVATADSEEPSLQPAESAEQEDGCCGLHLVCEKDSLSPMSAEIEYYDDEELDRFIGRDGSDYTPEEVEEFRDVMMTLRADDVLGWARSITQRRLELPSDVRDELLILVNEVRDRS
ncbi:MAG: phospholipase [Muribaculaceae bacterium]|nr:phospholipase [Muribaculaceae bacterium]